MSTTTVEHLSDADIRNRAKVAEIVSGLRQLADFVADNPALFAPFHGYSCPFGEMLGFVGTRERLVDIARAAVRAGLPVAKEVGGTGDQMFGVAITFGHTKLRVLADRAEVCERVVIGTEEVTEEVPDPAAVAALPKTTVTKTVEKVTWICKPLLAEIGDQQ